MTEIPIRTVTGPDKKSKPEEKPGFIVNGKEIKTHAELGREEYLKELLSPKLKYGLGSISVTSEVPHVGDRIDLVDIDRI